MIARPERLFAPLALSLSLAPTAALGNADHLLITEVGYDVAASPEDSEWFEIYNPTDSDIVLNDGTTVYYVTDDEDAYWNVVNGVVTNSGSDWTLAFPVGSVLPARSFAVIVKNDLAWFQEFFPMGQAAFEDQPGNPQIFEFQSDTDTVRDMINVGTGTALSLTNSGEDLVIFAWDGVSDLVVDVDHVCWIDTNELINKTGVTIDGPDADSVTYSYLPDAGGATAAPDSPQGTTIQRIHAIEVGETGVGGNGVTGHDESTEDWYASFVIANPTPGRFFFDTDGDLADLAAASAPVAVSMADGPGTGPVGDFGADGTITELYAVPEDTTGDGLADVLHIGVRGDFFATAAGTNGTFVGLDVNPGSGVGLLSLLSAGNSGSDQSGALDFDLTNSGVTLNIPAGQGIGLDAALGFTEDACPTSDLCGLRGFGSDGVQGSLSDYAFLGDFAALSDLSIGACDPLLPAAPGASYAAPDCFEISVSLADLNNPLAVALAAWTSGDGANGPSPNTLPETANDQFLAVETLTEIACVGIDDPLPLAFMDGDLDGEGDPSTAVPYCGGAPAGLVLNGDDCDDSDPNVNTAATETCDGSDENCDGAVDDGFDVDGDTFYDGADAGCAATYGSNVDCDDSDGTTYPSAPEMCDTLDNDCDLSIDEDFDVDGDLFVTNAVNACITAYGPSQVDCDDGDGTRFPGATEVCDGDDENCNATIDDGFDADGDTYFTDADAGCVATYGANVDCNDGSGAINPAVNENCGNGIDDDCDGLIDGLDGDCAAGDDDDSAGDDDDSAGDDDDATGDDDDATGDDDDATGDDDDATGDDDDATGDDDDSVGVGDDDDAAAGCSCSNDGGAAPLHFAWTALALLSVLVRRRRPGYARI